MKKLILTPFAWLFAASLLLVATSVYAKNSGTGSVPTPLPPQNIPTLPPTPPPGTVQPPIIIATPISVPTVPAGVPTPLPPIVIQTPLPVPTLIIMPPIPVPTTITVPPIVPLPTLFPTPIVPPTTLPPGYGGNLPPMPPIAVGTPVAIGNPLPPVAIGTPGTSATSNSGTNNGWTGAVPPTASGTPLPVANPPIIIATHVIPYSPVVLPNEKLGAKDIDE